MKVKDYTQGYAVLPLKEWNDLKEDSSIYKWFKELDDAAKCANTLSKKGTTLYVAVSCYEGRN